MDATQSFHLEMMADMLNNFEGTFFFKHDTKGKSLSAIAPYHIKLIEKIIITSARNIKAENFAGLTGLQSLKFADKGMLPIYIIYMYIYLERMNDSQLGVDFTSRFDRSVGAYSPIVTEIRRTLPNLNKDYIKLLLVG